MPSHPNRTKGPKGPFANPAPEAIREHRKSVGLTQKAAALMICGTERAWQDYEQGARRMHPGLWELFLIKTAAGADHTDPRVPVRQRLD